MFGNPQNSFLKTNNTNTFNNQNQNQSSFGQPGGLLNLKPSQPNTGGGLFGNNTQQPFAPKNTGFGNNPLGGNNTGGMGFGNKTASFGGNNGFSTPTNNQQNTGGIFGGGNQTGFGNKPNTGFGQNNTGFGQNNNQTMGFGNKTNITPINGIWGKSGNTNTGNLGFGGNNNTTPGFSLNNNTTNNAFGNNNKPFGNTGGNAFGNTNNNAFGNTGNNAFGNNNNAFGNKPIVGFSGNNNTFNSNTNKNAWGGSNLNTFNNNTNTNGSVGTPFIVSKNNKNNNVHNMRFMNEYKDKPMNLIRMQDYTMNKNNQINNPTISSSFNNYNNKMGGNNTSGMGMMNNNISNLGNQNQNTSPFGTNNNQGGFNLANKGFMNNTNNNMLGGNNNNLLGGNNNLLGGNNNLLGGNNNNALGGGLFNKPNNSPNLLTSNVIGNQQTSAFNTNTNTMFNKPTTPSFTPGNNLLGGNNQGGLFSNTTNNIHPNKIGLGGGLNLGGNKPNNTGMLFNNNTLNTTTNTLGGNNTTGGLLNLNNNNNTGGLFANNNQNNAFKSNNNLFKPGGTGGLLNPQSNNTGLNLLGNKPSNNLNQGGLFQNSNSLNKPLINQPLINPPQNNVNQGNQMVMGQGGVAQNLIQLPDMQNMKTPYAFVFCPVDSNSGTLNLPTGDKLQINSSQLNNALGGLSVEGRREDEYRKQNSSFYDYPLTSNVQPKVDTERYKSAKQNLLVNIEKDKFRSNKGLPKLIIGKDKRAQRMNRKRENRTFKPKVVDSFVDVGNEEEEKILIEIIVCRDDHNHQIVKEYFKRDDLVANLLRVLMKGKYIRQDEIDNFRLLKGRTELNKINGLDDYNIGHGDTITVELQQTVQEVKREEPSPTINYPKKSRKFKTSPRFEDLLKMKEDELRRVESFRIFNEEGEIEFSEPVDLTGVDIDKSVVIQNRMVEVYPFDLFGDNKPKLGEKLNSPAFITFYNFDLKKVKSSRFMNKLKQLAEMMNASIVEINKEESKLKIHVQKF